MACAAAVARDVCPAERRLRQKFDDPAYCRHRRHKPRATTRRRRCCYCYEVLRCRPVTLGGWTACGHTQTETGRCRVSGGRDEQKEYGQRGRDRGRNLLRQLRISPTGLRSGRMKTAAAADIQGAVGGRGCKEMDERTTYQTGCIRARARPGRCCMQLDAVACLSMTADCCCGGCQNICSRK